MKPIRNSCIAVLVAITFSVFAVGANGMSPSGLRAYGDTYTAMATSYRAAQQPQGMMTPAGLRAYGDTYQSMAISYLSAQQDKGVPVQWHDIFTGVGVTLGALLIIGTGLVTVRRVHWHGHGGRHTFAH